MSGAVVSAAVSAACDVHRFAFRQEGESTLSMMLGDMRLSIVLLGYGTSCRPYVALVDGVPLRNVRGRERRFRRADGAVAALRAYVGDRVMRTGDRPAVAS